MYLPSSVLMGRIVGKGTVIWQNRVKAAFLCENAPSGQITIHTPPLFLSLFRPSSLCLTPIAFSEGSGNVKLGRKCASNCDHPGKSLFIDNWKSARSLWNVPGSSSQLKLQNTNLRQIVDYFVTSLRLPASPCSYPWLRCTRRPPDYRWFWLHQVLSCIPDHSIHAQSCSHLLVAKAEGLRLPISVYLRFIWRRTMCSLQDEQNSESDPSRGLCTKDAKVNAQTDSHLESTPTWR